MLILKAIFGDWGKVFAPDNHSDAYKRHRLALWRCQAHLGAIPGEPGAPPALLGVVSEQEVYVRLGSVVLLLNGQLDRRRLRVHVHADGRHSSGGPWAGRRAPWPELR